jgi:hypothetical protein
VTRRSIVCRAIKLWLLLFGVCQNFCLSSPSFGNTLGESHSKYDGSQPVSAVFHIENFEWRVGYDEVKPAIQRWIDQHPDLVKERLAIKRWQQSDPDAERLVKYLAACKRNTSVVSKIDVKFFGDLTGVDLKPDNHLDPTDRATVRILHAYDRIFESTLRLMAVRKSLDPSTIETTLEGKDYGTTLSIDTLEPLLIWGLMSWQQLPSTAPPSETLENRLLRKELPSLLLAIADIQQWSKSLSFWPVVASNNRFAKVRFQDSTNQIPFTTLSNWSEGKIAEIESFAEIWSAKKNQLQQFLNRSVNVEHPEEWFAQIFSNDPLQLPRLNSLRELSPQQIAEFIKALPTDEQMVRAINARLWDRTATSLFWNHQGLPLESFLAERSTEVDYPIANRDWLNANVTLQQSVQSLMVTDAFIAYPLAQWIRNPAARSAPSQSLSPQSVPAPLGKAMLRYQMMEKSGDVRDFARQLEIDLKDSNDLREQWLKQNEPFYQALVAKVEAKKIAKNQAMQRTPYDAQGVTSALQELNEATIALQDYQYKEGGMLSDYTLKEMAKRQYSDGLWPAQKEAERRSEFLDHELGDSIDDRKFIEAFRQALEISLFDTADLDNSSTITTNDLWLYDAVAPLLRWTVN